MALSLTAGTPVTSLPAQTETLSSNEVIAGNQYAILLKGAGGDQGSTIRVRVTATNSAGSTEATSTQTAIVTG